MRATVTLRNVVGVGGKRLVVGVIPLQSHFNVNRNFLGVVLGGFLFNGLLDINRIFMNSPARRVFIKYKGADAAFAFKADMLSRALVA